MQSKPSIDWRIQMKSLYLAELYQKYKVSDLTYGILGDKLGDLYEELILKIFSSMKEIHRISITESVEQTIMNKVFELNHINLNKIKTISSTNKVPKRKNGASSKTDVNIHIVFNNNYTQNIPLSIKQSTKNKVSFAEFDVKTIAHEVNIRNSNLLKLMNKHQMDGSAKNFSAREKKQLSALLIPTSDNLVRWVLTRTIDEQPQAIEYPINILQFKLNKQKELVNFDAYTIDEYIRITKYAKNGSIKKSGFGTGLSWTYASGSKGKKIQFKC